MSLGEAENQNISPCPCAKGLTGGLVYVPSGQHKYHASMDCKFVVTKATKVKKSEAIKEGRRQCMHCNGS